MQKRFGRKLRVLVTSRQSACEQMVNAGGEAPAGRGGEWSVLFKTLTTSQNKVG
jgi:hypothetical protein